MSSILDSDTDPFDTARVRFGPQNAVPLIDVGPGIATSSPAKAVATPVYWAFQSETTKPWNPSSVFNSPLRVALLAQP